MGQSSSLCSITFVGSRDGPVDPLGGVPLLILAALIQVQQPGPAVVVFPVEAGGTGNRYIPSASRDRGGVVVIRAHGGSPDAWRQSRLASLLLSSLRERKGCGPATGASGPHG